MSDGIEQETDEPTINVSTRAGLLRLQASPRIKLLRAQFEFRIGFYQTIFYNRSHKEASNDQNIQDSQDIK